jgi:membrane-associated phospholipid phosphatase
VNRRWLEFDRFSFSILLTFYLSYFGYLLFPALGPRYFLAHFHDIQLSGKGIYHAIRDTLDGLENIQWDAFPSGHVGIALVYLHFAFRYFRRIFYVSCFVVLLLILSTVYLRYHYVVDVLGGVILYGIVMGTDRAMRWPAPESKFKDFN